MNWNDIKSKTAGIHVWAKAHPVLGGIFSILLLIAGLVLLVICNLDHISSADEQTASDIKEVIPKWLLNQIRAHNAYLQTGSVTALAASLAAMFGAACGIFARPKGSTVLYPGSPDTKHLGENLGNLLKLVEERVRLEQKLVISVAEVKQLETTLKAMGDRKELYKENYHRQLCERRLMLRTIFLVPFVALACLIGCWIYPQQALGNWEGFAFLVSFGLDRNVMHSCVTSVLVILIAATAGEVIPRSRKLNKVTAPQILFAIVFAVFAANLCYLLISLGYERYYREGGSQDAVDTRGINELVHVTLYRLLILPAVAALGAQTLWHGLNQAPEGNPTPEDTPPE